MICLQASHPCFIPRAGLCPITSPWYLETSPTAFSRLYRPSMHVMASHGLLLCRGGSRGAAKGSRKPCCFGIFTRRESRIETISCLSISLHEGYLAGYATWDTSRSAKLVTCSRIRGSCGLPSPGRCSRKGARCGVVVGGEIRSTAYL